MGWLRPTNHNPGDPIMFANEYTQVRRSTLDAVAAFLDAQSNVVNPDWPWPGPSSPITPSEGDTVHHPEHGEVTVRQISGERATVSVGDVTLTVNVESLFPSVEAEAEITGRLLASLCTDLKTALNRMGEIRAPIGFYDVVNDRGWESAKPGFCNPRAVIKDGVFERDMNRHYESRYNSTTIDAVEGGDEFPSENWSFEDCNGGRYECRERPVVAYLIRDSESEDGIDLYGSAGSGGETTYPHGDHDKSYDLDYCWDQRDECEDAIGRLCAELDLEDSRFEIEEHEQDDDDTCRWGVWDTDSEEWIDVDGEGDIDSYDEDDEDDVERTVEEANDNDRRKNVHGFPFASSYCWDVTGNEWDWKFLADAGYIIATYSRDGETTTVAGVGDGGYCFDSSHKAPAYLLMAADRNWLVETEHGPRRVKADPMRRLDLAPAMAAAMVTP